MDLSKKEYLLRIRRVRIKAFAWLAVPLLLLSFFFVLIYSVTDSKWFVGMPICFGGLCLVLHWWVTEEKPARNLRREILKNGIY